MADVRESFPVLEDGSQVGKPLAQAINATTDPTGLSGLIGFSFKDNAGNVVLPSLDASGKLPVSFAGAGTDKKAYAKVTGSLTQITVVNLSLVATKVYREIECIASCSRESAWEVVGIDDPAGTPVETILTSFITGPGQFSFHWEMSEMSYTAGATAPVIRIRALNMDKISDLRGTITALELA